jgi:hypothetical protein
MTNSDATLVDGIIVILRGDLDHTALSRSTSDDVLRPHADRLFKRIRAGDRELELRRIVWGIQEELGLPLNDHRCKGIVSQTSALVRKNSN